MLVMHFRRVENGDLSTKVEVNASDEFGYVFNQFNQMTSGVKRLLISLDNEYVRRDLAERKQLQSQINPHFLYNSLFYIISVAEDADAVRKMTNLLAQYYQYQTKSKSFVTIEEEIYFARTYLGIMSLRKSMDYEIHFNEEEDLMEELILPLIIQPLLENAIQHGIEDSDTAHRILLEVKEVNNKILISVEDDGPGLTGEQITNLMYSINLQANHKEKEHIGLWNVNQRLINYYGKKAAIFIERSSRLGGLQVRFTIEKSSGNKSREKSLKI